MRTQVFYRGLTRPGGLTMVLIMVSVAVTIVTGLGKNWDTLNWFLITDVVMEGNSIKWHTGLPEVMNGQVWRLITPVFVHFGFIHIIFNMLWLNDLGNMVESRKGSWFLALFVAVTGISANVGQYLWTSPLFGGMSGVVYGLLGYVWMKGKFDPLSRMSLDKNTVFMMLFWYVLCFTPVMPVAIANVAHTIGLVIGVLWGYFSSIK